MFLERLIRRQKIKIILIWNLFFRLVSAYEDKILISNEYNNVAFIYPLRRNYGDISFKSFVKMILEDPKCHHMSHCQLDVHWRPYFANCCYCKVPFQYFVRMESLEIDVEFIGRLANVQFQKRGDTFKDEYLYWKIRNLLFD